MKKIFNLRFVYLLGGSLISIILYSSSFLQQIQFFDFYNTVGVGIFFCCSGIILLGEYSIKEPGTKVYLVILGILITYSLIIFIGSEKNYFPYYCLAGFIGGTICGLAITKI